MATKTRTAGFRYVVPYHVWASRRAGTILAAKQSARRKRKPAKGDPTVYVVLEWPGDDDTDEQGELIGHEHC